MIRLGFTEEPSGVSADTMTKEDPQSELLMLRRRVAELETREALSDTSEKETVAEALRVSEEKYRRIFEHAIEGIFQSTPDGRFITVNPAYARMFGYGSPEEMINEVTDIASQLYANPADREEVQQRFEDPVPLTNYEVEWLRKDGTHFWVAINARSVRDESGRILYYEGMIEDITARKESEEALRKSESLLREAQRVAHIGHWELDSPAGTPKWSEEISHILGLDPSGGAPSFAQMQHILHPDDWDLLNGMIIRGCNQGVPFDIEVRCIRPDQSIRWVNAKGYPTKKRGGKSFRMFGTAQDITQRKQAEARIHRQGTLLGAINSILREALESESDADIVRTCLRVAEEITGSRFGFIGEVNKNGCLDTIALSDPGWTECRMLKADLPQLINNMEIRGIWGSVLKSEQSLIINNPASHPDSVGVPDGHTPITSFMGIPLKRSGKTFGLIALANKHGGYEPSDVADMEAVSGAFVEALDRQRAERALQVSEDKYRTVVENMQDVFYRTDMEGTITMLSPSAAEMAGYDTVDQMIGLNVTKDLYKHPADKDRLLAVLKEKGKVSNFEVELVRRDGDSVRVSTNSHIYYDKSGQPVGVEGVFTDITAHKRAEEALRKSEERLELALQAGDLGLWDLHIPTGKGVVNQRSADIVGYSIDEIEQGIDFWASLLHPDDHQRQMERLHDKLAGLTNYGEEEFRLRHKSGEWRWVLSRGKVMERDPDGKPLRITGTYEDITDKKLAELQAAEANELRERIFSDSPIGIAVYRADGQCISANEALGRIVGADVERLLRQNFRDLASWKDSGLLADADQVLCGGINNQRELQVTTTFGKSLWLDARMALLASGGEPHLLLVFNDITDRKKAEEALRESEEKYRSVVENMQDVFYRTDMQGTITMVSPSAAQMADHDTLNQIIGLNVAKDLYRNPADRDRLLAVLEEKGKVSNFEVELVRRDGDSVIVSTNSHIYYDKSGQPLGVEGVFTDITARKRAENAVRESEEKYRILVENANEGIFVAQDGVIKFLNPKMSEMFGYSKEESMSNPMTEFVHPDDRERILQSHFRRLAGDEAPIQYPFRLLNKDGQIRWAELVVARIPWEGKPAALAFITDITERKAMEEAVKESEEWHRSLVENSFDGIFVQQDGKIVFANSRLYQMLGYSAGELEGMEHWRVYYGKYQQITCERAAARMRGEKMPPQYEVMLQRKDGSFFEGEVSAKVVNVKGRPGVQAWVKDISKKKRTEETQLRLATVVQQASEAVVIMDANNKVQYVNPAFEKITGYSLDDVIAQTPKIWKEAAHDDLLYQRIWETVSSGEVWRGQLTNRRKDGTLYLEDVTVSPVRDTSGQIINYVAMKRDISREVQLQQQLLQSQKMEAIGTLAGGIAHDFNNLLTVVMGFSELLLAEKERDHQEHDDLQTIFHAARNGAELVQRLLMFSRKSEPKPVPMNLNKQIVQVEKLLRRTIPKMIDVKLELSADLPQIDADPSQVEQVIMNLAVNARDAMPDKGKLTLRTDIVTLDEDYCRLHLEANPGNYVLLEISDTGQGMDKETVEHIFEPFFTTKEMGRGTGLGLAMVFGIIKQHNGHITVYSEVGIGTTFRVYLPAMPADVEAEVEDIGIVPAFGTETVLLVDDEEFVRELGARILTKHGYTVLQAVNGREGLDLFKKERSQISLVVLDLIMPEIGGPECLKELLKIDPKVKILIASGFSADASVKETIQMGAKGFVNKPFRVKEFLRDVRKVLDES